MFVLKGMTLDGSVTYYRDLALTEDSRVDLIMSSLEEAHHYNYREFAEVAAGLLNEEHMKKRFPVVEWAVLEIPNYS